MSSSVLLYQVYKACDKNAHGVCLDVFAASVQVSVSHQCTLMIEAASCRHRLELHNLQLTHRAQRAESELTDLRAFLTQLLAAASPDAASSPAQLSESSSPGQRSHGFGTLFSNASASATQMPAVSTTPDSDLPVLSAAGPSLPIGALTLPFDTASLPMGAPPTGFPTLPIGSPSLPSGSGSQPFSTPTVLPSTSKLPVGSQLIGTASLLPISTSSSPSAQLPSTSVPDKITCCLNPLGAQTDTPQTDTDMHTATTEMPQTDTSQTDTDMHSASIGMTQTDTPQTYTDMHTATTEMSSPQALLMHSVVPDPAMQSNAASAPPNQALASQDEEEPHALQSHCNPEQASDIQEEEFGVPQYSGYPHHSAAAQVEEARASEPGKHMHRPAEEEKALVPQPNSEVDQSVAVQKEGQPVKVQEEEAGIHQALQSMGETAAAAECSGSQSAAAELPATDGITVHSTATGQTGSAGRATPHHLLHMTTLPAANNSASAQQQGSIVSSPCPLPEPPMPGCSQTRPPAETPDPRCNQPLPLMISQHITRVEATLIQCGQPSSSSKSADHEAPSLQTANAQCVTDQTKTSSP